jgi:chromosome segregation ATPase
MTDPNDDVLPLGDINISTARQANEHIDQAMAENEAKIEELQKQVATLEDERDSYKDQAEKAADILEEIQAEKRQKLLARIEEANEAVAPDQEVDLSSLAEADVATLEQVASVLEVHAEAASQPVSNQNTQPDLSNVEDAPEGASLDDKLNEVASSMGLGRSWDTMEAGFGGPELAPDQASDDPSDRLAAAIRDITKEQVN